MIKDDRHSGARQKRVYARLRRAVASSPESMTTNVAVTHDRADCTGWGYGSRARAYGAPRDDSSGYAAFCFITSSRSARRKILPTGVFGNSSRNSMNFGRL